MSKTIPEAGHNFSSSKMSLKGRHAGVLFSMTERVGVIFGEAGGSRAGETGDMVYSF